MATAAVFVDPVAVAEIVSEAVPRLAVELAVSLSVVLPLPGNGSVAGEKLALTPAGRPCTKNATGELKPPKIVDDTLTLVLPPRLSVKDGAPTLREMPGACSVNVTVLLTPPPVAVTASVYVPGATALPTVMPKMLLPEPGALMVPADVVTPLGRPVTFRLIGELKLTLRIVVAVTVPVAPGAMDRDDALRVSEKLGAGNTLIATSAVLVVPPPVAVTFTA
jgi:hypothetical protein